MKTFTAALFLASATAQTFRSEARKNFYIGSAFNVPKIDNVPEQDIAQFYGVIEENFNIGTAENHCKPEFTSLGYTGNPA